jgi:hypothetical protein
VAAGGRIQPTDGKLGKLSKLSKLGNLRSLASLVPVPSPRQYRKR